MRNHDGVRNEFLPVGALAVGLLAGLGFTIPLAHGDAKPSTISPNEIKDGMKGYGLTVFKGTQPERFDVERPARREIFHAPHQLRRATRDILATPRHFFGSGTGFQPVR